MVLSLSARGLTQGEISAHLAEVYGAEVSKATISTITEGLLLSPGLNVQVGGLASGGSDRSVGRVRGRV
jgi:hypothetical protein